jgi:RimJ/RimL family protein N-acetyltransferase
MPDWHQPILTTERLLLRPLVEADAPRVRELAGDVEIARNTLDIPHPYPEGAAETWIASHPGLWRGGTEAVFAITLRDSVLLVGCVGLSAISARHRRADIGWWVGREYWNRGYCTEAARALLDLAFGPLELNRVYSSHYARNPASGRVMQKLGMKQEGIQRRHVERWGDFHDLVLYGILREEWQVSVSRLDRPGV